MIGTVNSEGRNSFYSSSGEIQFVLLTIKSAFAFLKKSVEMEAAGVEIF